VVAGDARINELQIEIDERCFTLLALRQPVAIDLRTVVLAIKINADLDHMHAGLLQPVRPLDVVPLVEPRLQFDEHGETRASSIRGWYTATDRGERGRVASRPPRRLHQS